jgi:tetratricopeptide (TPR) repeat protein
VQRATLDLEYYDNALEIDPNHAATWNNKGAALNELGKYNEAIECFDKALEIEPKYANAWLNKGVALKAEGKSGRIHWLTEI